jgi:23S rRNA pseudouridine1911/1915/1917 synthase
MRLDLALIKRHPELSRRKARDVIEKGQVTLGGALVREAGTDVPADADILWNPHRKAQSRVRSSLPLLYEDTRLLIVDKPAGLLTVPSSPEALDEDTALERVREYVARLRPRKPYVGLVHRIDRGTSGAVAFALDSETRHALIQLFARHAIDRRYLAIVRGEPSQDRGRIDAPIEDAYREGRRRIARDRKAASSPAVTHFELREKLAGAALLEVRLETGRQHQIRLHLAHIGLPLLGDRVYGREHALLGGIDAPRPMLHAASLGFDHPWGEAPVRAASPVPEDFESVLKALRRRLR